MDPALIAERARLVQGELASASTVIDAFCSSDSGELSGPLVHELLEGVGGLTALLTESDTAERQRVYRAAGVHLRYQRTEEGEKVTASLHVGLFRVGGGVSEGGLGLPNLRHRAASSPTLSAHFERGRWTRRRMGLAFVGRRVMPEESSLDYWPTDAAPGDPAPAPPARGRGSSPPRRCFPSPTLQHGPVPTHPCPACWHVLTPRAP